jgi:hypothetical protein
LTVAEVAPPVDVKYDPVVAMTGTTVPAPLFVMPPFQIDVNGGCPTVPVSKSSKTLIDCAKAEPTPARRRAVSPVLKFNIIVWSLSFSIEKFMVGLYSEFLVTVYNKNRQFVCHFDA